MLSLIHIQMCIRDRLRRHDIGNTAYTDFRGKRARQVTREDYDYYDYLLCADSANTVSYTHLLPFSSLI